MTRIPVISREIPCVLFTIIVCAQPVLAGAVFVQTTFEETDELLANPGMGWQTFGRTRGEDKNLPDWIPSTVHYARWGWGRLEPRPDEIDYAFLDGVLSKTRAAGQKLAFRVMCCSTSPGRPYHPDWLKGVGGRIIVTNYGNQKELPVPDLDDDEVLARHLHFIHRLGARYDGHPDIDHIDLGTVGWWGEWHMSNSEATMPSLANRKLIIETYLASFKKTPLVMLIGSREDRQCLPYAVEHGAGWRADCLGDLGGFSKNWCHMCDAYAQRIEEAGVQDAWKRAPVAWESCWDMRRWVDEGWSLRYIFDYALAMHGSFLNNKSAPLPQSQEVRKEIERFLRRLGYRFVLRELKYPMPLKAGDPLTLEMKWQNVGSAPCYKPYRLAYRLTDDQGHRRIIVGQTTVETWMPGTVKVSTEEFIEKPPELPLGPVVEVTEHLSLPADLRAESYSVAIAIVGEQSTDPIVKLAIKGRLPDGWYPVCKINIGK